MIRDIIFPPRCPVCEDIVPQTGVVCDKCRENLPYVKEPRCLKCSKEITDLETDYCADCSHMSHIYESGKAVWNYDKKMAASIARFKYHDKREYASWYVAEMVRLYGSWIRERQIDAMIPVPIHKRKKYERGYNQAEIIAELLGESLNIPVISSALIRVKYTKPQKELSLMERSLNLDSAFDINDSLLKGIKRVAIIDDIYTTGSTIDACARVLRDRKIDACFLCVCIGSNN